MMTKKLQVIFFVIARLLLATCNTAVDFSCTTPSGRRSYCVSLYSCEYALDLLTSRKPDDFDYVRRSQCGLLNDFMVCCDPGDNEESKTDKNETFNDDLPDETICGFQASDDRYRKSNRTALDEFPWMALLNDDKNSSVCTGTLISKKHVLTTAVCVTNKEIIVSVSLGVYNKEKSVTCIKNGSICTDHSQVVKVKRTIPHPYYKNRFEYDIALVRLSEEVRFSDFVRPICLPFNDEIQPPKENDILWASGWGMENRGGKTVEVKKKIQHRLLKNGDCSMFFHTSTLDNSVLCTIQIQENNVCKGDAGGPLMFYRDFQWYVEAIVSFGAACGKSHPQGATNVRNVLSWIYNTVNKPY